MAFKDSYDKYQFSDYFKTKIPEHWVEKRLGYLSKEERAAFVDGPFGSDLKTNDYKSEGVPLIQLNNIRDSKHITINLKFVTETKKQQLIRHVTVPGDVVIAKMADPVARSAVVVNCFSEYVIVADCVKMSPNLELVDLRYLVWSINCDHVRINAELVSTGTTRIRINLGELKKLKIPYPSKSEQKTIANFLDHETAKIDTLIEKQQQLIKLLKEKRQAVISHAVTKGLPSTTGANTPMRDSGVEWLGEVPEHWVVAQLKFNTLEMQTGPFGSQLHAEDYVEGGIPLINPAHMINGKIVPDSKVSVDEETQLRLMRHRLFEGDIIFARRGELGRCAVITKKQEGWLCGTGSLKAKLNNRLIPEYSYLLITSDGVVSELSLESKGSTMDNLNTETLGRVRIPVPPTNEQREILNYVNVVSGKFRKLIDKAVDQVGLLKERRTALISAAVTGKIDVRNWQAPESLNNKPIIKKVAV